MFGYVIPVKGELKVKEFDRFQAAYCGLCHSLKRNYGIFARFVLNYDFTFLAILLSHGAEEVRNSHRRCIAHPLRKRCCTEGGEPFRRAAGYSLILTRWKLRDGIADSGLIKGTPYRLAALFLGRAYRRAARDFPDFDNHCRAQLGLLRELEEAKSGDLDRVADAFAAILPHAAADDRIRTEILYHTGRWIYLIDAYDDLEKDRQSDNYNPLIERFRLTENTLTTEDRDWLKIMLTHAANRIVAAYNLLPEARWSPILENIIYLGFPAVTESVFCGRFRRRWGRWERRKDKRQV